MQALSYNQFRGPLEIGDFPDPTPPADGVVIEVRATGVCRSDWHGWLGHDPDIKTLPHVPGHEFAGVVAEVGSEVKNWQAGDRVTMPFVAGCGRCPECESGNSQVCDNQFQPGFTAWGSFAEYVAVPYADENLVRLPDDLDFTKAASLGCRVGTAYRAVALQGQLQLGQWVAIHGCGGLGLAAVAIASAFGARVIGIDIRKDALQLARLLGAEETLNATEIENIPATIRSKTQRGAHLSVDALGSQVTCENSIRCLRKRGRHVQVGLLTGDDASPRVPLELALSHELEIVGSHGLQASYYPQLLDMVSSGRLDLSPLIERLISLSEAPEALRGMGNFSHSGMQIIDRIS
ncbi:MAG: zinc-dependent alcohol dehydrogenase family protein [Lacipirellulaceae bacterium]